MVSTDMLRRLGYDVIARLGFYRRLTCIDWGRVERLVFVCKGNICRSVYAEYRARMLNMSAVSAGVETTGDIPANDAAIRIAAARSVDLLAHRSRNFEDLDLSRDDLVVVMEPWHLGPTAKVARLVGAQVTIAGLWLTPCRAVIRDPFGSPDSLFVGVFDELDQILSNFRANWMGR